MLRHRFVEAKQGHRRFHAARNWPKWTATAPWRGSLRRMINWASNKGNTLTRPLMEKLARIDRDATLPQFHSRTFVSQTKGQPLQPNPAGPAYGKRKAALYATCFVNYNKPATGMAARAVLNHLGCRNQESAIPAVAACPSWNRPRWSASRPTPPRSRRNWSKLIDQGYDIVALTASCGLMLKFEWALICPDNADVKKLAEHTCDIDEYVVDVMKKDGVPADMKPLPEGVTVHLACHARAQNMGPKAAEMLKLLPDTPVDVIERCSGHGGTFGVVKPTHAVGVKVGRPVFRAANSQKRGHIVSDCPLAAQHIVAHTETGVTEPEHPIQIMARAFGLTED